MLARTLILSSAAALTLAAGSLPARADDWHHDGGGWHGREWHHEWREHHGYDRDWHGGWGRPGPYQPWVYAAPPPVYYAPPPVYAPPPPTYYAPPPGASFSFGW